ncbi:MAG: hypothetical protein DI602_09755 [Aliarcobacter butzleri]|nr:MAG: hypothetical protein DI602_09755 [Aliarcobacter butzleri]
MTIGTAIFLSVCIIVIAFILSIRQETQTIQHLPCKCKDCCNYKDCPIGAGKTILIWKKKENRNQSDKI